MQQSYLPPSSLWIPTGSQIIVLTGTCSLQRGISNGVRRLRVDTYWDLVLFYPNQTVQSNRILGLMEDLLTASIRSNCPDFLGLHTIDCNACLAYTGVFQGFHFDRGFQVARQLICSLNSPQENWLYSLLTLLIWCITQKTQGDSYFHSEFKLFNAFSLNTNSHFFIPLPDLRARDCSVQKRGLVVERRLGE